MLGQWKCLASSQRTFTRCSTSEHVQGIIVKSKQNSLFCLPWQHFGQFEWVICHQQWHTGLMKNKSVQSKFISVVYIDDIQTHSHRLNISYDWSLTSYIRWLYHPFQNTVQILPLAKVFFFYFPYSSWALLLTDKEDHSLPPTLHVFHRSLICLLKRMCQWHSLVEHTWSGK